MIVQGKHHPMQLLELGLRVDMNSTSFKRSQEILQFSHEILIRLKHIFVQAKYEAERIPSVDARVWRTAQLQASFQ